MMIRGDMVWSLTLHAEKILLLERNRTKFYTRISRPEITGNKIGLNPGPSVVSAFIWILVDSIVFCKDRYFRPNTWHSVESNQVIRIQVVDACIVVCSNHT